MKLSEEQITVAKGMRDRGTSVRQLAKQFGVTEERFGTGGEAGGSSRDLRADQPPTLD